MKTMNLCIAVFLLMLSVAGCVKKEEAITPKTDPVQVYGDHTLPQGDHEYDTELVALYKKYNTLILYKYLPKDVYWNVNNSIEVFYDENTNRTVAGYQYTPAEEAYIRPQLNLLKEQVFKYFPDEFLKKNLPRKILLMDKFFYVYGGTGRPEQQSKFPYAGTLGFDYLGITGGNAGITGMTPEQKRAWRVEIIAAFLQKLTNDGVIPRISAFTALTNYSLAMPTNEAMYGNGIIIWAYRTPNYDWDAYLKMLTTTTDAALNAPGGFWNPGIDNKGTIRKKSDVMINYYKTKYNIDLRAIANDL